MTRYKLLPPIFGDAELEGVDTESGGEGAEFTLDGYPDRFWLPASMLAKVEVPLPAEPSVGAVVRAQLEDEDRPWVFAHLDDHQDGFGWYGTGYDKPFTWKQLNARRTPVPLVPAPGPVELPWTARDTDDYNVEVDASDKEVYVTASSAYMTPVQAREMSRALWTAADAAEAQS